MILLDTHTVLWWQAGGGRLSARASREIAKADSVLISPISCWEIGVLLRKERIELDRELYTWVSDLFAMEGVVSTPLTPQAAVGASMLGQHGFHGDPADRFLYATARELSVPFVTKDDRIHRFAGEAKDVKAIW